MAGHEKKLILKLSIEDRGRLMEIHKKIYKFFLNGMSTPATIWTTNEIKNFHENIKNNLWNVDQLKDYFSKKEVLDSVEDKFLTDNDLWIDLFDGYQKLFSETSIKKLSPYFTLEEQRNPGGSKEW